MKLLKKEKMTDKQKQQFLNEVEILRKLDHPNIIKLFEVYEDKNFFYLVQE